MLDGFKLCNRMIDTGLPGQNHKRYVLTSLTKNLAWSSTTTTCFDLMELNGLTHDLCNNPNTFDSAQIYLSLPSKAPEFNVILQWSRSYHHNCQRFIMAGRGN